MAWTNYGMGLCVSGVVVVNNLVVCWATDDVWYKSLGILGLGSREVTRMHVRRQMR